jgi:hypothetical protein
MYKVTIINANDSRSPWIATFSSQETAQEWLDQQKLKEGRRPEEASYVGPIPLDSDPEWLLQKCHSQRRLAYPSLEQILEVILDHGFDSVKYTELQALREQIKQQFPKP